MKKQAIAKGIVFMLTIIMIVPVIASAQSEGFTISGEVKFKKHDLEGYKYMRMLLPTPSPSQEGNKMSFTDEQIPLLGGARGG